MQNEHIQDRSYTQSILRFNRLILEFRFGIQRGNDVLECAATTSVIPRTFYRKLTCDSVRECLKMLVICESNSHVHPPAIRDRPATSSNTLAPVLLMHRRIYPNYYGERLVWT